MAATTLSNMKLLCCESGGHGDAHCVCPRRWVQHVEVGLPSDVQQIGAQALGQGHQREAPYLGGLHQKHDCLLETHGRPAAPLAPAGIRRLLLPRLVPRFLARGAGSCPTADAGGIGSSSGNGRGLLHAVSPVQAGRRGALAGERLLLLTCRTEQ